MPKLDRIPTSGPGSAQAHPTTRYLLLLAQAPAVRMIKECVTVCVCLCVCVCVCVRAQKHRYKRVCPWIA